jgi:hypothetical protein
VGDQFVDLSEEFHRKPYSNLLCRHANQYTAMGCLVVCHDRHAGPPEHLFDSIKA